MELKLKKLDNFEELYEITSTLRKEQVSTDPQTLNPKPQTLNPKLRKEQVSTDSQTLNPKSQEEEARLGERT